jgi:hypothetical protein
MNKFYVTYVVTIEAEDMDEANIKADDIESEIGGIRGVKQVYNDAIEEGWV